MARSDVKGSAASRAAKVVYRFPISEIPTIITAVNKVFIKIYAISFSLWNYDKFNQSMFIV